MKTAAVQPRESPNRPRKARLGRRRLFRALAVSFSLVLAVCIAEVGLRLADVQTTPLLVRDAETGRRYLPRTRQVRYVEEARGRVELRFNDLGFRGPDWGSPADAARRWAILGDSFVAAVQVPEAETMSAVLEARLASVVDSDEAPPRVLNCGVSGFGTAQEYLAWKRVVRPFEPSQVVLVFYNGNDLHDNSKFRAKHGEPAQWSHLTLPIDSAVAGWFKQKSRVYGLQRLATQRVRHLFEAGMDARLDARITHLATKGTPDAESSWDLTESILALLAADVREAGAELTLVSIPTEEQVFDDRWSVAESLARARGVELARDWPERRLAALCQREGVRFVQVRDAFTASPSSPFFSQTDGRGHLSEAGHAIVAERLFSAICADGSPDIACPLAVATAPAVGSPSP